MLRRMVVVALWIASLVTLSAAPPEFEKTATGFLPRRDMLPLPNVAGRSVGDSNGSCNGLDDAAMAIFDGARLRGGLTAAEIGKNIVNASHGDTAFQRTVSRELQNNAYVSGGIHGSTGGKVPIADSIGASLKGKDARPQRLVLIPKEGPSHMVIAYDVSENGDSVTFRVGDPNFPPGDAAKDAIADSQTITYNRKTGKWKEQSFSRVALVDTPIVNRNRIGDILSAAQQGRRFGPLDAIEVPSPGTGSQGESRDPKTGGVMMRFTVGPSPGVSEAEAVGIRQRLQTAIETSPGGAFALAATDRQEELTLVSLTALAASRETTLGPLTRIRGGVVSPSGEVFLAGKVEPNKPRIPRSLLIVALRSIWKDGTWPYVSLDPSDTEDMVKPHRVRIGGVPAGLENTEFVNSMLEADYLLKRITLGSQPVGIAGFKSCADLLAARQSTVGASDDPWFNRFWLSPLSSPIGDVIETHKKDAWAFWFEGGVQVLTESEVRSESGLRLGAQKDPIAEEVAQSVTRHYAALRDSHPQFQRLQAAFDLAKFAAILRSREVRGAPLDQIAVEPPEAVTVKKEYAGLKRTVAGGAVVVAGGASARVRVPRHAVLVTDRLSPLIDAGTGGTGLVRQSSTVVIPAVVEADPAAASRLNSESLRETALGQIENAEFESALDAMNLALVLDPDLPAGHSLKALSLFGLGKPRDALKELQINPSEERRLLGLRATLYAYLDKPAEAVRDANDAERDFPDEEDVLSWTTWARLNALDMPGAERSLQRLAALAPLDPQVFGLRAYLGFLHKLGPEKAAARLKEMRSLPFSVAQLFSEAALSGQLGDPAASVQRADAALAAIERLGDTSPAVLRVAQRCRLLLAYALAADARKRMDGLRPLQAQLAASELQLRFKDPGATAALPTDEFIQALQAPQLLNAASSLLNEEVASVAREESRALKTADTIVVSQPTWPSGVLIKALVLARLGRPMKESLALYRQAAGMPVGADPLMEDLGIHWGQSRTFAALGLMLLFDEAQRPGKENTPELIDVAVENLKQEPPADLLRVTRSAMPPTPREKGLASLRSVRQTAYSASNPDLVSLLAECFYTNAILNLEDGGSVEDLRETALEFLEQTARTGLGWDGLTLVALTRMNAMLAIAESYAPAEGKPGASADQVRGLRARGGPLLSALVGWRSQSRSSPLDGLAPVAQSAETVLDMRAVSLLLDRIRANAAQMPSEEAAKVRRIVSEASAQLRKTVRSGMFTPLDWSAWPSVRPATAAESVLLRPERAWPIAPVAGGVVLLAAILVLVRARRRRA